MKPKEYKVPFTWWCGWVVTVPLRIFFGAFVFFEFVCQPATFYGILKSAGEFDQSKWRFGKPTKD